MKTEIIEMIRDILPEYDKVNEGGHGREHIIDVITKSYHMAIEFGENPEVCCTAALLHDIGLLNYSRKIHHIGSAIYVTEHIDMLSRYFNEEEIYKIFSAVLEHRSGFNEEYTSLVSKIVSDADRSTNIYLMISRSYQYNKNKGFNEEKIYREVYSHLKEKYYDRKYTFISRSLQEELDNARTILENKTLFDEYYKKITSSL